MSASKRQGKFSTHICRPEIPFALNTEPNSHPGQRDHGQAVSLGWLVVAAGIGHLYSDLRDLCVFVGNQRSSRARDGNRGTD